MVYGLKHQHFTLHSITLFIINISHADIVTVNYEKKQTLVVVKPIDAVCSKKNRGAAAVFPFVNKRCHF